MTKKIREKPKSSNRASGDQELATDTAAGHRGNLHKSIPNLLKTKGNPLGERPASKSEARTIACGRRLCMLYIIVRSKVTAVKQKIR